MSRMRWLMIGVLLIANKAQANPLQISEARAELGRIQRAETEAKATLVRARLAYRSLESAADRQRRALELLIKSDRAKQLAQRNSVESVENGRNASAYYADESHGYGEARIVVPQGS